MKTGGAGMTNEEAIKEIIKMAFQIFLESKVMANQNTKDKHEALALAVNALEKQIPKKPDLEGDGYGDNGELIYDTGYCPNCRCQFEVDYDVTDENSAR